MVILKNIKKKRILIININIEDNFDKDKSFIQINENYLVILKKRKI